MNKIINNKKYDTETTKMVGSYDNGEEYLGHLYVEEKLYQKKTGEFFLYGWGGALTEYREKCGSNTWTESSRIVPYSIDEAKEWAMEHMDGDEYEEVFGPVEE